MHEALKLTNYRVNLLQLDKTSEDGTLMMIFLSTENISHI